MIEQYMSLLGLDEDNLSEKSLDKKFKEQAKYYHPDLNKNEEAHHQMKVLIDARDTLKKYLKYRSPKSSKIYHSHDEVYNELKDELFKIIEKYFKILDGYSLCKRIWPTLENYNKALKDKPGLAAKGGFAKLFRNCGFITRVYDKEKKKSFYKKQECSISSGMKLLNALRDESLIDYTQKGKGRGSRVRVTINTENLAKFIIKKGYLIGMKVRFLEYKK